MINKKPIYEDQPDLLVINRESDNSDDDASNDNLEQDELYKQVYLKNQQHVKAQMRKSLYAEQSFMKEFKLYIETKRKLDKQIQEAPYMLE